MEWLNKAMRALSVPYLESKFQHLGKQLPQAAWQAEPEVLSGLGLALLLALI